MSFFVIEFTKGDHKGQRVAVTAPLLLGRSHSAGVLLTAPDVSGKHLQLEVRGETLVLQQKGSGKTWLNDEPVAPGTERVLKAGDRVSLAGDNAFSVRISDAAEEEVPTAAAGPFGEETSATKALLDAENRTQDEPPEKPVFSSDAEAVSSFCARDSETQVDAGTWAADDETQAIGTLAFTPEIEESLFKKNKAAARRRFWLLGVLVAGVSTLVGIGAWYSKNLVENPLTWPVDAAGQEMYFDKWVDLGDPALPEVFGFFTPDGAARKVNEQSDAIAVDTHIGKRQEVPCRFRLERVRSQENLTKARERGFAEWREKKIVEGWRFEVLSGIRFAGRDGGVPYQVAKYTRTDNGTSWSGFAQYLKFRDWDFILRIEVPDAEWYRGETLLAETPFFLVKPAFVAEYWEPDGTTPRRSVEDLLEDVSKALSPQETPGQMLGTVMKLLRDALTLALVREDEKAYARGTKLLHELKRRQSAEYNDRLREFELAKGTQQIKRARALRTAFLGVFNDENDQRYHELRNGSLLELEAE